MIRPAFVTMQIRTDLHKLLKHRSVDLHKPLCDVLTDLVVYALESVDATRRKIASQNLVTPSADDSESVLAVLSYSRLPLAGNSPRRSRRPIP